MRKFFDIIMVVYLVLFAGYDEECFNLAGK